MASKRAGACQNSDCVSGAWAEEVDPFTVLVMFEGTR